MDAVKVLIIFLLMLVLIFKLKKSLTVTFIFGCAAVAVAFRFDPVFAVTLAARSAFSKSTFAIVAIYYTVTFLQKMMEAKGDIDLAQDSLLGITNNKRLSAALIPMCVGLMPSPGAVVIGGAMVDSIYGNSVGDEDKNFITSYYRHVPESFLPTFGSIVLACELAKVPLSDFVLYMAPLALLLFILGYFMIMRHLPWETGMPESSNKLQDVRNVFLSLWPVGTIIFIVLAVKKIDVYLAATGVIVLYFFVNKFRFQDVKPFFKSAFEPKVILSTIFILVFKDYIMQTDAVESLPRLFAKLPLPDYLIFSLIFFVGSVIVGSTAIAAIGIPLAYAAIPDGGTPLLVLLSSMAFAAMQVSISHICLFLSSEFFKVEFASLIKKTIPVISVFCVLLILYYLLLTKVLFGI